LAKGLGGAAQMHHPVGCGRAHCFLGMQHWRGFTAAFSGPPGRGIFKDHPVGRQRVDRPLRYKAITNAFVGTA
jgi:hypothetical protein